MKRVYVIMASVGILIAVVAVIYLNYKQPVAKVYSKIHSKPAPLLFDYPIEIKSSSNPLHINQEFTIKSKEKQWDGSSVSIYYLKSNESNTDELMYMHVLPKDSELIGKVEISQGQWEYKWHVPEDANAKGYGSFYIAVKSDKGIISGVRVDTLSYDSFIISPKEVSVGQEIKYNISGFPKGCTMEIYLLQVKPGINPGERIANLGVFKRSNGSVASSFKLPEVMEGNKITAGEYIIQATIIPKNEKKEARQAVFSYFSVK